MLYAFYGISIVTSAFALLSNKKFLKQLAQCICFIFMFIFLGWAAGAYDVEIGISRYVNYQRYESFTEIGFQFLVLLGHSLNLNYRTFYVILSFFELCVIYWFVNKHCKSPVLVFVLFMLYPMVTFFQYTRNLLAFAFALLGFSALITKSKLYVLKYIIFILIASSIHLSSLFFLLYLPATFISSKKLTIIAIIGFLIISISSNINFIYDILNTILGEDKVNIVSGSTNAEGSFGRISSLIVTLIEFWGIYVLVKNFYKIDCSGHFSKVMVSINILSILFIPLTLNVGVGFGRLQTLLTLVNYVYIVNKVSEINSQKSRVAIYGMLLIIILILFVANYRNEELRQLVLYPFFEDNEFLKLF